MNAVAELMLQNTVVAALFALLVAVGSRLWRHPAVSHFLWLLVLVKLLSPPLVAIPIRPPGAANPARPALTPVEEAASLVVVSAGERGEATWAGRPAGEEAAGRQPKAAVLSAVPGLAWCLGASLAGSVAYFLVLGLRVRRFAGLLGRARTAPPSIAARAARLCKSMGLSRHPEIRYVPGRIPPTVWGWGAGTRILLPAALFERLDAPAQDALLVHELAHVRRWDHWVRLVEILVTGLYWWNPVVWLARKELREAEEECCDRYVLRAFPGASRTYAGVLVDTVDFLCGARFVLPPVASAAGPTRYLKRRIEMVMCANDLRSWSWMSRLLVGTAALLLLPLGASWADDAKQEQTKQKVIVVEANSGGVVGEGVLVVTAPEKDAKAPVAGGETKPEKVESKALTVVAKGNGHEKTSQLHVPLNVVTAHKSGLAVAKGDVRKLKAASRPKSVTIAYADGSKETIELGDCDSLTLDVTAGTVCLARQPRVLTVYTTDPHFQVRTKVSEPIVQVLPHATKSHVATGTVVTKHKADEKKDGGIQDRLERLEQTLLKLQQEIKSLKKK